jgi:nickel-dependent lactate racemase
MDISLTKNIFGSLNIPNEQHLGTYGLKNIGGDGLSDEQIKTAIENPIGTQPIRKMAKGRSKILIVTDDNTRPTPLPRLIGPVLNELKIAGVQKDNITFLIGLGTHCPMDRNEIKIKFGDLVANQYRIENHAWDNPKALVSLGNCELGFEVTVNKLLVESDLVISIGNVVPHATTGFSGGGKTIVTGIAGQSTIENTHWMALDCSMSDILGKYNNPVREAINKLSHKTNLDMIINTVLFDTDKIYGLVAGSLDLAHKEAIALCRQVYGVNIPHKADIVIAEAYPTDINLRQAIKAICAADLVCRDRGVIILPAECPEKIAHQFPEFAKYGFKHPEELYNKVENGTFKQKLLAYTLVAIGRIICRRVKAILVSPNIDQSQAEQMGFLWASNLQKAVYKAFQLTSDRASVIALKQAGVLLPVLP